jgi:hypothetical protein
MRKGSAWPVRTAAVGPVAVGAVLWRLAGQLMVTFVVKATFAFEPGGRMKVVDPEPIRTDDDHQGGHPMKSLVGACETAPMLRAVDVVLTGHAYPSAGETQAAVRLGISGGSGLVLEKTLQVTGDRGADGAPMPFERMPLVWERAHGGIGHGQNPIGTGVGSSSPKPPNITYPEGVERGTAGFGPIPATFPVRRKLLGATARKAVTEGVFEIPIGFDWSYFQSAPPDQQVRALAGDEWLLLEGMHAGEPKLRTRLPGAVAVSKIYGHEAAVPDAVPLKADMLHVDADRRRCAVVWRGSFPLPSAEALDTIVVAGSLELPDEPALWPETASDLEEEPFAPPAVAGGSETVAFDAEVASAFGTAALGPDEIAALMDKDRRESPLAGTVAMSEEQLRKAASPALPFAGTPEGAEPTARKKAIVPGAPWEKNVAAAPVEAPRHTTTAEIQAATDEEAHALQRDQAKSREADEARARRELEEARAKREAEEAEAKRMEREAAEAEERRRAEAERFAREQEEARRAAEQRAAEEAQARLDKSKKLRDDVYGGFKRKR